MARDVGFLHFEGQAFVRGMLCGAALAIALMIVLDSVLKVL